MFRRVLTTHHRTADLTDSEIAELWDCYGPHHNVTSDEFTHRIRHGLDGLAIYRCPKTLRVVGLTGMRRTELTLPDGSRALALYSGNSYVEHAYRGLHLLQRFLAHHALSWKARHPLGTVYIWFDALSFKTYVLAARNNGEYYPSRHRPTPAPMQALMDRLGTDWYGDAYVSETGAIRKTDKRLKEHVAPIGPSELADPDIAHYAALNPGHARGDGLLTVIPFTLSNLVGTMIRGLRKQLRSSEPRDRRVAQVS